MKYLILPPHYKMLIDINFGNLINLEYSYYLYILRIDDWPHNIFT